MIILQTKKLRQEGTERAGGLPKAILEFKIQVWFQNQTLIGHNIRTLKYTYQDWIQRVLRISFRDFPNPINEDHVFAYYIHVYA